MELLPSGVKFFADYRFIFSLLLFTVMLHEAAAAGGTDPKPTTASTEEGKVESSSNSEYLVTSTSSWPTAVGGSLSAAGSSSDEIQTSSDKIHSIENPEKSDTEDTSVASPYYRTEGSSSLTYSFSSIGNEAPVGDNTSMQGSDALVTYGVPQSSVSDGISIQEGKPHGGATDKIVDTTAASLPATFPSVDPVTAVNGGQLSTANFSSDEVQMSSLVDHVNETVATSGASIPSSNHPTEESPSLMYGFSPIESETTVGDNSSAQGSDASVTYSETWPMVLNDTGSTQEAQESSVVDVQLLAKPENLPQSFCGTISYQLSLKWNITGEAAYTQVILESENNTVEFLNLTDASEKTWESGLIPGQLYTTRVSICQRVGSCSSEKSDSAYTWPKAPTINNVTSLSTNSVSIAWHQDGVATSSTVEVNMSSKTLKCNPDPAMGVWNSTWISCNVSGFLMPGFFYSGILKVCRDKDCICSAAFQMQTVPATPKNMSVFDITSENVTISWIQNGNFSNYSITVDDSAVITYYYLVDELIQADTNEMQMITAYVGPLTTPGRRYTVTVAAISGSLWSENATIDFRTIPAAPKNVSVIDITSENATISWIQRGGFTNFNITVDDGSAFISQLDPVDDGTATTNEKIVKAFVWNLSTPGRLYNVTIAAISGSMWSEYKTTEFNTVPAVPKDVTVVDITSENATISWIQHGVFTNFSITIDDGSAFISQQYPVNDSIATEKSVKAFVWNLSTPGKWYNIRIAAISGSTWSEYKTIGFRTILATPENVSVSDVTSDNVTISWIQRGDFASFNITVDDYSAFISEPYPVINDVTTTDETTVKSQMMTASVWNLSTPGRRYTISIAAVNGSVWSKNKTIVFHTIPAIPRNVSVSDITTENATISWIQRGVFTNFSITIDDDSALISQHSRAVDSIATMNETNVKVMTAFVRQLSTPGRRYNITITAISEDQRSSDESVSFNTKPSEPTSLQAVEENGELHVTWRQSGTFDFCSILVNSTEMGEVGEYNCTESSDDNQVTINCVLESPVLLNLSGSLLSIRAVVRSGHQQNEELTEIVLKPSAPQDIHVNVSAVNATFCFDWKQTNFFDAFQYNLVFYNGSESIDVNSTKRKETKEPHICLDLHNLFCPGSKYMFSVAAESRGNMSNKTSIEFYSAPLSLSSSCFDQTNSSIDFKRWQNRSDACAKAEVDLEFHYVYHSSSSFVQGPSNNSAKVRLWNLTPGVTYEITSWTVVKGHPNVSSLKNSTIKCTTVPNPPSGVKVTNISTTNGIVSWSPPDDLVRGYRVSCVGIDDSENYSKTMDVMERTATCKNLAYATQYKVIVRSSVNDSISDKPLLSSPIEYIFVTVSNPVTDLKIEPPSLNSFQVTWKQPPRDSRKTKYRFVLQIAPNHSLSDGIYYCSQAEKENCDKVDTFSHTFNDLKPSTNYTITVWIENEGGKSEKKTISAVTPDDPLMLIVLGSVLGVLVLTAILLIIIYWRRRRTNYAVPSTKRPSVLLGFPNPSFTLGLEAKELVERMRPDPFDLDTIDDHVDELHRDSDFRFSAEYSLLTEMSPKNSQAAAEIVENRTKNRYCNILPFDHSRVKLVPLDEDEQGSDYINASYMPGFTSKREFIAAQGPMKSTVDDFWRMIWEQNTTTIVMVTNLQERGREKCAEYWPMDEEPVFYGDLQVQLKSESQLNYYVIRVLDVKLGEKRRTIKHLHFIAWPDFGCPENTTVLLDFVTGVRSHMSNPSSQNSGPILVHCSAGVGRTGTFILIDRLLQHIRVYKMIDIFGLVLEMRHYRCNMIQTEAQYIFAYECLKTAAEKLWASNAEQNEDEDESVYQNMPRAEHREESTIYQNFSKTEMESAGI